MNRPPRAPLGRSERRILLIFAAVILTTAVLAVAAQLLLGPADDVETDDPLTASPTAVSQASPPGVATPEVALATPAPGPADCDGACLVRLADTPLVRGTLAELGIAPNYAYAGQVWVPLSASAIDGLRASGVDVTIIVGRDETLPFYMLRAPDGMDPNTAEAAAKEIGEVVDRSGRQFMVRATELPPPVRGVVSQGMLIEKLPPVGSVGSLDGESRVQLPPLDDLASLLSKVSTDELETTIRDLQAMSSTDGTGIGTRQYTTTGNVMAGEYLYQRFASYGLNVWFEDFVTDDGLLALNVVAEIPGDDASETYLVLGHYDSLNDVSGPDQSEAPGADDNASGVAGMLEIARVLSQHRLAHPVRFFATNVEEVGLQGVKAFARRLSVDGTTIAGAYNMDAIGSAAHGTQLVLNADSESAWLQKILVDINERYGLGQSLLVRQNPVIVADDNFLRDAGVPTVLVARELFGWSSIVHTAKDTLATIDLDNVRSATQLVLLGLATLVQDL